MLVVDINESAAALSPRESRRPVTVPRRFQADLSDETQVIATIAAATSHFGASTSCTTTRRSPTRIS